MRHFSYIQFWAMGCQVTAQVETDSEREGKALLADLPAQVEAVEARLSRFRPESELMRFNRQAGQWVEVSDLLLENIHAAKHAARLTDGLYNPLVLPALLASGYDRSFEQITAPQATEPLPVMGWQTVELRLDSREVRIPAGSAIDLSGIAKGWMAAKLADQLAPYGSCLINLGGDMAARGAPTDQPGWVVEVENPHTGDALTKLWLSSGSITTSGVDYRRWKTQDGAPRNHIIDPRTGLPVQTDALVATIIHPNAPTAEAFAKAVLLKGAQMGLKWLGQQWDAAGLVFQQDGKVLSTPNFRQYIITEPEAL